MRALSLRLIYTTLICASLLYMGAGDARAFLLTLTAALAFASMIERYLHVYEALSGVLHFVVTAVGAIAFYIYPDINTRTYIVLCVLAPLIVYLASKYEEEKVEEPAPSGEQN